MRVGFGYAEGDNHQRARSGEAFNIATDNVLVRDQADGLAAREARPQEAARAALTASSAPTRRRARRSSSDPRDAVAILALISLSLAIVNLFPFLPLDGGHIFWAIVEMDPPQARVAPARWSARASSASLLVLMLS